jgi:uncharacterized protein (TIGR02996 family)
MTDEDFLRAIEAAPADDSPRLIYADWLEERGQSPKAEFLRIEARLAHDTLDEEQRAVLGRTFGRLRNTLEKQWLSRIGARTFLRGKSTSQYVTLAREIEVRERYFQPLSARNMFAEIILRLSTTPSSGQVVFLLTVAQRASSEEDAVPLNGYVEGVRRGIDDSLSQHEARGLVIRDLAIRLVDLQESPVDSSFEAFRRAGLAAMSRAIQEAELVHCPR